MALLDCYRQGRDLVPDSIHQSQLDPAEYYNKPDSINCPQMQFKLN